SQKVAEAPRAGGTYKEATWGDLKTLNPFFASSQAEKDISSILFLKLIDVNDQGKWQGVLLDKFEVGENEAILEFRDKVYWHNGDPVTTDDFIFTIDVFKTVKSFSLWQKTWQDISVEKVSNKKVVLTYPNKGLLLLNLRFPLLPQKILKENDLSKIQVFEFNIKPIGNGPYQFESIETEGTKKIVTLTKFDQFYKEIYIEKMQFFVDYSLTEAVKTFKGTSFSGLVQMPLEEIPNIKDRRVAEHPLALPQYTALFYNQKKSPLDDKETRQMMDAAINRDQIVSNVQFVQKTVLPLPAGMTKDKAIFDQVKAKEILTPKFKDKELKLSYPDSYIYAKTAELLKAQFSKVGVKIKLDPAPELLLWSRLQKGDFEIALWSESVGKALDLSRWYSSNQLNFSSFSSSDIDERLATAQNEEAKIEIARLIRDEFPASFLYSAPYVWASRNLRGVGDKHSGEESSDRFRNLSSWYLVQTK
ncbi:MAG: ABC transporter substrate-binding protein, partial [Patescibacteria group bacterium]|nr:ABC transporter substrate-binding protein [Patescibacteria group bacterium]